MSTPDETLELLTSGSPIVQKKVRAELVAGLREDGKRTSTLVKRMLALAAKERSGVPLRGTGGFACIEALAEFLGPKRELPRECDGALSFTANEKKVRKLFSRIPMARRLAMFDAWIAEGSWSKYLMPYLDLAPRGAETILAKASAEGDLRKTLGWDGFRKWRRRIPQIEATVKRYEALLEPLPPPKPPRVGSFSFVEPTSFWPDDYATLDDVGKSQYRQAAGAYVGVREVKSPRDFIRLLKRDHLDESDAEMRRWKVMRAKKHVYDLWVVWVENGSFFQAGTKKRVPVHIVQGAYDATIDDPAARDLAEDLAASERRSLWSKPKMVARK